MEQETKHPHVTVSKKRPFIKLLCEKERERGGGGETGGGDRRLGWSDSGRDRSLEWDDRGYRASSGVSLALVDNGDDDDRDNAQDD